LDKVKDLLSRAPAIMRKSLAGLDYDRLELGGIAFDCEKLMDSVPYTLDEVIKIQRE
jgi:hypothetical protein